MNLLRLSSLALAALVAGAACSSSPNLLGGREKCWPESEPRLATLMRGTLELEPLRSNLATPEGEDFPLGFVTLAVNPNTLEVVDAHGVTVAMDGEDVTLFGGMGSDGILLVCAIEDRHGG